MTAIAAKYDPATGKLYDRPCLQIPAIDTQQITPLDRRLIGKTFYEAMERFYSIPDNMRRFEAWRNEQKSKEVIRDEND